jgi:CshA-type fibril repeat protein
MFTYQITDSATRAASAVDTVTVTPVAVGATAITPVGVAVTLDPVANDTGSGLALTAVAQPSKGVVAIKNGKAVYTPPAGYSGIVTYQYTVTDTSAQTATATDTVKVVPAAANDATTTPYRTAVTIDVVPNDKGSKLKVTAIGQPATGTGKAELKDGKTVYTPPDDNSGTATYTYTVTDAANQTATATVAVTVGAPPTPVASDDTKLAQPDRPVTLDPLANDTPADPTAAFVRSSLRLIDPETGARVLSVTVDGEGTYTVDSATALATFTPVRGFTGSQKGVKYQVTDSLGNVTVAGISVNYPAAITVGPLAASGENLIPLINTGTGMMIIGIVLLFGSVARRRMS